MYDMLMCDIVYKFNNPRILLREEMLFGSNP